jgi:molybdopterin converting factor small subunit
MSIKVLIPTPLRPYAGKQSVIEVTLKPLARRLSDLVAQHPDLRKHLFSEDGKLRSFVNVYLNDEDIRYLSKDATPVKETDTITIVPSVAGGR